METTHYTLPGPFKDIALIADMHERNLETVLRIIDSEHTDIIAIAGDMTDRAHGNRVNDSTLHSFREFSKRARVFFTPGNHERSMSLKDLERIRSCGVTVLDNSFVPLGEKMFIGGLTSFSVTGLTYPGRLTPERFIRKFSSLDGFRILLCHHPEYYQKYFAEDDADLILSGHAHGGQWRILGRGVFAPGQGLFPKYTKGVYDGRLVVSAGVTNSSAVPRLFDPTEVVYVHLR